MKQLLLTSICCFAFGSAVGTSGCTTSDDDDTAAEAAFGGRGSQGGMIGFGGRSSSSVSGGTTTRPTSGGARTAGGASTTIISSTAGMTSVTACQLVPQSGCLGQACDLDYTRLSEGATTCRAVANPGREMNTCASANDCAAGFICLGSCKRFCENDTHCGSPGGACLLDIRGPQSSPVLGVSACTQNCDPMTSAGCPSDWGCGVYRDPTTQHAYTDCQTRSAGTQGTACTTDQDCAVGNGCVGVTTNGTTVQSCAALCRPGSTTPACPTSTSCHAYNPAVTLGTVSYGFCMAP